VHVDFTFPFGGPLRKEMLAAASDAAVGVVDGGCIAVFQGPRLESAGEIEMARRAGCDMAGMTSLPEAGLARELAIDYAALAVVSNWGAGVHDELISEDNIAETLVEPMSRVRTLLAALVGRLGS
jgi:5'-methylthioinosine phosphorylase